MRICFSIYPLGQVRDIMLGHKQMPWNTPYILLSDDTPMGLNHGRALWNRASLVLVIRYEY